MTMSLRTRFTAICVAFALSACLGLFGQTGLGSINGDIRDATGAKIPNASLRLVENDTGIVTSTTSNQEGLFNFPSLVIGQYTLTISAKGFKEKKLANINVSAFQQVSLGSITLEVGQGPAETVTVTTEQVLVKDSGVRTNAIISRQVDDMPLQ